MILFSTLSTLGCLGEREASNGIRVRQDYDHINTKYEKKPNQFCMRDKCLRWEEEAEGTKNVT